MAGMRLRFPYLVLTTLMVVSTLPLAACDSDESPPDDGADGGAGGAPLTGIATLFPLKEGYTWTYQVTTEHVCEGQGNVVTREASGPMEFEGKRAFELTRAFCTDEVETFSVEDDGIFQWNEEWTVALPSPIDAGEIWEGIDGKYRYRYDGNVIVAAGVYGGCWTRLVEEDDKLRLTFCPRVGIVRAWRNGYLAELRSAQF
jgi:hypothetical protein